MSDNQLSGFKGQYAMEVYEKFKAKTFLMEGFYTEDRIEQLALTIDLLQNNLDPNDANQQP